MISGATPQRGTRRPHAGHLPGRLTGSDGHSRAWRPGHQQLHRAWRDLLRHHRSSKLVM